MLRVLVVLSLLGIGTAGCENSSRNAAAALRGTGTAANARSPVNWPALNRWPNYVANEFAPDHEWMYRWPDDILGDEIRGYEIVSTPANSRAGNRGRTVENWGRPIVLRHMATGKVMSAWFYMDRPRTISNPTRVEEWPGWIGASPKVDRKDGMLVARRSGVKDECVVRKDGLLLRISADGGGDDAAAVRGVELMKSANAGAGADAGIDGGQMDGVEIRHVDGMGNRVYVIVTEPNQEVAPWKAVAERMKLILNCISVEEVRCEKSGVVFFVRSARGVEMGACTGISLENFARMKDMEMPAVLDLLNEHAWALMKLPIDEAPIAGRGTR